MKYNVYCPLLTKSGEANVPGGKCAGSQIYLEANLREAIVPEAGVRRQVCGGRTTDTQSTYH